jgi:glycosyltransferase involved in cell wall biosynthesis
MAKHCIDVDKYACTDMQGRTKSIVTIAWMSRTENVIRKGVLETIELFHAIHERDHDFRLTIIGPTGEGTVAVRALIRQLGLDHEVTITGAISEEDKIARLQRAVAYTQLSKYEGFGIAAIEALAAGAVVIHSNAGGLREAVGKHGLVWSSGDRSCVDQLFQILGDPQRHAVCAAAGLNHVQIQYSREMRLNRFRSILADLGHG